MFYFISYRIFNYTATFGRESDYPLTTQFIVDANDWVTSKYFVSTEEKNRFAQIACCDSLVATFCDIL